MKRITVTVDEDVLEDVRRATGERTFSATINKVLSAAARVNRLREGLKSSVPSETRRSGRDTTNTSGMRRPRERSATPQRSGGRPARQDSVVVLIEMSIWIDDIRGALEKMVRVHRLRQAFLELEELKKEGPMIREGYLAEIRPNAYEVLEEQKKRTAAHERP